MPNLSLDISMSVDGFIAGPNLQLHVAPVLLGDGVRPFDGTVPNPPHALERTRVVESPTGVTHVSYRGGSRA